MWIVTDHYGACNLSLAYKIVCVPTMKRYNVIAEFLVATGTDNELYSEKVVLKRFDDEVAAEKFIVDIVSKINAREF